MNRDEILSEVRRRHAAAGSKVSRLRQQGIDVASSGLDPRRDMSRVSRYSTGQLRAYLSQLNEFNARSTKFVGLAHGVAVPLKKWSALVHETNMYNIRVAREYGRVADTYLPRGKVIDGKTGKVRPMTIAERDATLRPKNFITAGGEASSRPYTPREFVPSRINGLEALDKFTNDMRRRNAKDYSKTELKRQRAEAQAMMNRIGASEFVVQLNMLTDSQFNTMWNYSRFADDTSLMYEHIVAIANGKRDRSYETVMENTTKDIRDMFRWARGLPKE